MMYYLSHPGISTLELSDFLGGGQNLDLEESIFNFQYYLFLFHFYLTFKGFNGTDPLHALI